MFCFRAVIGQEEPSNVRIDCRRLDKWRSRSVHVRVSRRYRALSRLLAFNSLLTFLLPSPTLSFLVHHNGVGKTQTPLMKNSMHTEDTQTTSRKRSSRGPSLIHARM